jgi:hypothetical protein
MKRGTTMAAGTSVRKQVGVHECYHSFVTRLVPNSNVSPHETELSVMHGQNY